jgi:hypothetical protein
VPPVIESIVYTFLAAFIFWVVSFFLFLKTASKTLVEVEAVFEDASAHEEICVTRQEAQHTRRRSLVYFTGAGAAVWKVEGYY